MVSNGSDDLDRRTYLKGTAAGLGALSAAGCLESLTGGGDESVTLTAASAGGSFGEILKETFYDPFEEETGHTIDEDFGALGQKESKIRTNREDPPIDLFYVENTRAIRLAEAGLVRTDLPDLLENTDRVNDQYVTGEIVSDMISPWGLAVNTGQIDKEITSWFDLHDTDFQGRVAFPSWAHLGSSWIYLVNRINGGSSEEDISAGLDFLATMVEENDAQQMNNTDHGRQLLSTEEAWLMPFYNARTEQVNLDNDDVDLEFVYPEEGALGLTFGFTIVDNIPEANTEVAADVIDYSLDPEKIAVYARDIGYPSPVEGWREYVSDDVVEDHPSLEITEAQLSSMGEITGQIDWAETVNYTDEHSEQFQRTITGNA